MRAEKEFVKRFASKKREFEQFFVLFSFLPLEGSFVVALMSICVISAEELT